MSHTLPDLLQLAAALIEQYEENKALIQSWAANKARSSDVRRVYAIIPHHGGWGYEERNGKLQTWDPLGDYRLGDPNPPEGVEDIRAEIQDRVSTEIWWDEDEGSYWGTLPVDEDEAIQFWIEQVTPFSEHSDDQEIEGIIDRLRQALGFGSYADEEEEIAKRLENLTPDELTRDDLTRDDYHD